MISSSVIGTDKILQSTLRLPDKTQRFQQASKSKPIKIHRNLSKPAIETCQNPSKPIETYQNRKVLTFAKMGLGFCLTTLVYS